MNTGELYQQRGLIGSELEAISRHINNLSLALQHGKEGSFEAQGTKMQFREEITDMTIISGTLLMKYLKLGDDITKREVVDLTKTEPE